jgi:hypothetical protein
MSTAKKNWGYAIQGRPVPLLQAALQSLQRDGLQPRLLPSCAGEPCGWVRQVAECLKSGECKAAVVFCDETGLACCVSNKVAGIRAVAVTTVFQAKRALQELGANLLIVETAGKTFFELRQMLKLCATVEANCPAGVACVLQELDGHAHR